MIKFSERFYLYYIVRNVLYGNKIADTRSSNCPYLHLSVAFYMPTSTLRWLISEIPKRFTRNVSFELDMNHFISGGKLLIKYRIMHHNLTRMSCVSFKERQREWEKTGQKRRQNKSERDENRKVDGAKPLVYFESIADMLESTRVNSACIGDSKLFDSIKYPHCDHAAINTVLFLSLLFTFPFRKIDSSALNAVTDARECLRLSRYFDPWINTTSSVLHWRLCNQRPRILNSMPIILAVSRIYFPSFLHFLYILFRNLSVCIKRIYYVSWIFVFLEKGEKECLLIYLIYIDNNYSWKVYLSKYSVDCAIKIQPELITSY